MHGYVTNIERATLANEDYRRVLYAFIRQGSRRAGSGSRDLPGVPHNLHNLQNDQRESTHSE